MTYTHAPVVEALIDIQVTPRAGLSALDLLAALHPTLRDDYPEVQELPPTPPGDPSIMPIFQFGLANGFLGGARYLSADRRRLVQVRLNGFSFHLLCEPDAEERRYNKWDVLRDEARSLWDIYRKMALPESVIRVGLRYINRFDLRGEKIRLSDYFAIFPQRSGLLSGQAIANYALQMVLPQADIHAMLVINQALGQPRMSGTASVVLDLDLYRDRANGLLAEEDIWPVLEALHTRKNEAFEACITDLTRDLIR